MEGARACWGWYCGSWLGTCMGGCGGCCAGGVLVAIPGGIVAAVVLVLVLPVGTCLGCMEGGGGGKRPLMMGLPRMIDVVGEEAFICSEEAMMGPLGTLLLLEVSGEAGDE